VASWADAPLIVTHRPAQPLPASARQWERTVATDFLTWRHAETGCGRTRLESVCAAVGATLDSWIADGRVAADAVARRLPAVLADCDRLDFADASEAMAYLVLHLADRYGRATQALELLLAEGWLPIRRKRMAVLDVGGGPAPGLYAALDVYDDLTAWATSTAQPASPVRVTQAHVLDRGSAWDQLLHYFSESLLAVRRTPPGELPARLPFRRYHADLRGFSVLAAHHAERARIQQAISREYDLDDEPISSGTAWRLAYQERTDAPSAYDLIILCNFLTNTQMTEQLADDLFRLAKSLTPGGVLLVLGATGASYPAIYAAISRIAASAGLIPVSGLQEPIIANAAPTRRALIAAQARGDVAYLAAATSSSTWNMVREQLPADVVDPAKPFKLPRFRALVFQREFPRRGK
jgi:hypothetical protein